MRIFGVLICLFFIKNVAAQNAMNMTLLDQWSQDSLLTNSSLVRYSDCYGFTWNNEEYAVAGSTEGTHIFRISAENKFVPKGFVKGRTANASVSHRDYATYQHYLYAVSDEGTSNLQIIDFQYLPDSIHLVKTDSVLFGRVHNIFIDTAQQKLYSLIHRSTTNTQTIQSPMKIFSLADPLSLAELWSGPNDVNEVHDAHIRNGLAFLNCGYDGLRVYDFTNTNSPAYIESMTFYQDQGYNHQGWLTPDGSTYLFADETAGKRVKKCSFNGTSLQITNYFGTDFLNGSVPHNIMANDTFCFVAYYNLGIHIYDMRYPQPQEIAYYDTYPATSAFPMNGNWGLYTLLPSKRILASDRQYGLFLFDFRETNFGAIVNKDVLLYPNPANSTEPLQIRFPNGASDIHFSVYDSQGRLVLAENFSQFTFYQVNQFLAAGFYTITGTFKDPFLQETTFTASFSQSN
jgi:choice-of-anchor B domain-containing protein